VPDVSQQASDALLRVMAKNPADRFQSYDEFTLALQSARSSLLIQQYSQSAPSKSGRSWWRRSSPQ